MVKEFGRRNLTVNVSKALKNAKREFFQGLNLNAKPPFLCFINLLAYFESFFVYFF